MEAKKTNRQAEKLLLAGFMRNPETYFDYAMHLSEDDFTTQGAKMTFDVIRSLMVDREMSGISRAKLIAEARSLGYQNYLKATRDGVAIDEMMAEPVTRQDLGQHFLEVKRQTLMRAYTFKMQEVLKYLETTGDPLSKVIATVENEVIGAVSAVDCGETEIRQLTAGLKEFIYGLADNPGHLGLDLGFPVWQSRIGQLRRASVSFVVANMKAGKSQFGLRAGIHTSHKLRLPVLYIDTELSESDQKVRTVGMLARVPYNVIETGYWSLSEDQLRAEGLEGDDLAQMLEYRRRMHDDTFWEMAEKLPIDYLSVSGKPLEEVIPHMRRWVLTKVKPDPDYKFPQCLVIYDYLKLASLQELRGGRVAEWQLHGLNYAMLHDFAKRHHLPILAFGQTNNQSTDDEQCIAGAKRIGENVTSASLLRPKTEEERAMDPNGSHIIKTFVTRHGAGTRNGYINVDAELSMGQFEEIGLGTVNFEAERQRQLEEHRERGRRRRAGEDDDDE